MTENVRACDHKEYIEKTFADGPLKQATMAIAVLSELLTRMRIHLRNIDNLLLNDRDAEPDVANCQKLLEDVEDKLANLEFAGIQTAKAAQQKCLAMTTALYDFWVKANCDETLAQQEIEELKAKLTIREERLREHGTHSPELRARVLALTGGKCAYCCIPISDSDDGTEGFEVEHVVAKDNGGPDHFANYVPSCRPCNSKKRTSHVLEFIHFRLGIAHPEPLVSVSEETPVSIDVVTRSDEFLEAAE